MSIDISSPEGHGPRRAATTVRIAMWSAHHRWPVLALWLLTMIGLFVVSASMGGAKLQGATGGGDSRTEAQQGIDAFTNAGHNEPGQSFWLVLGARQGGVADPASKAAAAAIIDQLRAATVKLDGDAQPTPIFESITSPLEAPAMVGLVAADGKAEMAVGRIAGESGVVEEKTTALEPLLAQLAAQHPELRVMPLSSAIVNREVGELVNNDLDGSLKLTLPLTFLILLFAFGTVIAGLIPIFLAITALIGAFGAIGIYSRLFEPISQQTSQVVVLIGLAVAIDYSLFLISRFRTERRAGRSVNGAIEVASSTAGRAVFFSGMAVAIALAGLLMMDDPIFRSIAIGTICVVVISVVGSLTFLPATLALLGRRIEWLSIPYFGGDRAEGTSIWGRLVRSATAHPVVVSLTTGVFLVGLALPVSQMRLGMTGIDGLPATLPSVQAWQFMAREWPQGTSLTLDTYVSRADRPETKAAISAYQVALAGIPGIGQPSGMETSGDGTIAVIHDTLPGGSNDRSNWDLVGKVRAEAVPAAFAALPDVKVWVSGEAAAAKDLTELFGRQTPMVMAFVLGLSFLLLLVVFHSVVIPLVAILMTLLSAGAAFGALQLVFQQGWFGGLLDVTPSPLEFVAAGHRLHHPVRALDGLPGVHPDPRQGGSRPRPGLGRRGGQGHLGHRRHGHQRGGHHGRGLRRVHLAALRDDPADGLRLGGGHPRRRDHRAQPADAVDHEAAGRLELVHAALPALDPAHHHRGRA